MRVVGSGGYFRLTCARISHSQTSPCSRRSVLISTSNCVTHVRLMCSGLASTLLSGTRARAGIEVGRGLRRPTSRAGRAVGSFARTPYMAPPGAGRLR